MTSIAGAHLVDQLNAAEASLVQAAVTLHRAQLTALLGIHYDDTTLDAAILNYRRARRAAAAARSAWQRWWNWPRWPDASADQCVA